MVQRVRGKRGNKGVKGNNKRSKQQQAASSSVFCRITFSLVAFAFHHAQGAGTVGGEVFPPDSIVPWDSPTELTVLTA
jgi:hypothetical protein